MERLADALGAQLGESDFRVSSGSCGSMRRRRWLSLQFSWVTVSGSTPLSRPTPTRFTVESAGCMQSAHGGGSLGVLCDGTARKAHHVARVRIHSGNRIPARIRLNYRPLDGEETP